MHVWNENCYWKFQNVFLTIISGIYLNFEIIVKTKYLSKPSLPLQLLKFSEIWTNFLGWILSLFTISLMCEFLSLSMLQFHFFSLCKPKHSLFEHKMRSTTLLNWNFYQPQSQEITLKMETIFKWLKNN